jgi:FHA domain-containing protein
MATPPMSPGELSTNTDPRSRRSWRITDAVIRLRERGTIDRVYGLPDPPARCKIGSASQLRLHDASGLLSREHAELVPIVDGGWKIRDLKSKNGLRCDGEPVPGFRLRPGLEITIGGLRLVAESLQLIGLLAVIRRFLGWAADRQDDVDEALRSLRDWAAQRTDLVVVGDGDLTRVIRRLHDLVVGREASFIVYEDGDPAAAVRAAACGTLCVVIRRQADAIAVVDQVHAIEYAARPQLVVCTENSTSAATIKRSLERPEVISLPPLSSRSNEVERIAHESAADIVRELGAPGPGFSMHDLERLQVIAFDSIEDVEETVRRIVVMRTWGVTAGAAKLGLDHSSLSTWARRRKLST